MKPCIGIIDSGVSSQLLPYVALSRRFSGLPGEAAAQPDAIGHGDQLARAILQQCDNAQLLLAQVFLDTRRAPVERIVEAIDWLVANGAQLINMSFGLRRFSVELEQACEHAAACGVVLLASSPSTGGIVYPAALPSCLAVTGDIRCGANELSWLDQSHADFGANSFHTPGSPEYGGGASIACARITGMAAQLIVQQPIAKHCLFDTLKSRATYIGPEPRRS